MKTELKEFRQLIKSYVLKALQEAEKEEEAPKEEEGGTEEENPFAAAAEEEPSKEEEEEAPKEEEGGEEKKPAAPQEKAPEVKFNISAVKKYNRAGFTNDTGVVKKVTKDGLTVQVQPDDVEIFVNFNDISESVKQFFKSKK